MDRYKKFIQVDDEELKDLYISLATSAILDYTNRIELLDNMKALVFELANYYALQEGKQGLIARSEGAISETYQDNSMTDGIPGFLKSRLERYKLLHIAKKR